MRTLELIEIEEWCASRGLPTDIDDPTLRRSYVPHVVAGAYSNGTRSGNESELAAGCVTTLGEWTEALAWIRGWGIWPSHEDWPAFYGWRGALGEKRSLQKAPAHLFSHREEAALAELVSHALGNAWDVVVYAVGSDGRPLASLHVSHDDWLEIHTSTPIALPAGIRPFDLSI